MRQELKHLLCAWHHVGPSHELSDLRSMLRVRKLAHGDASSPESHAEEVTQTEAAGLARPACGPTCPPASPSGPEEDMGGWFCRGQVAPRALWRRRGQWNQGPTSRMGGRHQGGVPANSGVTEAGVRVPAGALTGQVPSPVQNCFLIGKVGDGVHVIGLC